MRNEKQTSDRAGIARGSTGDRSSAAQPSRSARKRTDLSLSTVRSALSNGSSILQGVDHRSAWVRRFRDLIYAHEADAGGEDVLSEGQRSIIRRAAMLELQLEMMESKFADNDGEASAKQLDAYQRTAGALRRLIEALGLHQGRKLRDVTPDPLTYAQQRAASWRNAARASGANSHAAWNKSEARLCRFDGIDLSSGPSAIEMTTVIIPAVCRRRQRRHRVGPTERSRRHAQHPLLSPGVSHDDQV